MALLWPVTTSQPLSVCANLCYVHLCVCRFVPHACTVEICVYVRVLRVFLRSYAALCVYQEPTGPHRATWPSAISTGANSGSRRQLNLHPRGQSSGRKQMHLRQSRLCGEMTYAPTCQIGLAGFDSWGYVAAPPVHYVLVLICTSLLQWVLASPPGFNRKEICSNEK